MKTSRSLLFSIIALVAIAANAESDATDGFQSLNSIEDALNPLDVLANHDGIRRSIDLNILFETNSASLSPDTLRQLEVLGQAMAGERLKAYSFVVAGHTDAVGDETYNQTLSQLRAEAVVNWLVENFSLSTGRFQARSMGESALKPNLPADSASQRRVEIIAVPVEAAGENSQWAVPDGSQAESAQSESTQAEKETEDGQIEW